MLKAIPILISLSLFVTTFTHASEEIGSFIYQDSEDIMDQSDTSSVFTSGVKKNGVELGWQCDRGDIHVVVKHQEVIGNDGRSIVTYRFDGGTPTPFDYWDLDTSRKKSFAPDRVYGAITRKALVSDEAAFQVQDPYTGKKRNNLFKLNGLNEALNRLECYDS